MDPIATVQAWLDETDEAERYHIAQDYNRWAERVGFHAHVTVEHSHGTVTGTVTHMTQRRLEVTTATGAGYPSWRNITSVTPA